MKNMAAVTKMASTITVDMMVDKEASKGGALLPKHAGDVRIKHAILGSTSSKTSFRGRIVKGIACRSQIDGSTCRSGQHPIAVTAEPPAAHTTSYSGS